MAAETEISAAREQVADARARRSHPDSIEILLDDVADAHYFVNDVIDIALVALYHWVERDLKRILARSPRRPIASHMNVRDLHKEFAADGLQLGTIRDFRVVDLLRVFANSWKHNSGKVAENVYAALKLRPPGPRDQHHFGHFANPQIAGALRRRVRLGANTPDAGLVAEYARRAARFLDTVVRRASMGPPLKGSPATTREERFS